MATQTPSGPNEPLQTPPQPPSNLARGQKLTAADYPPYSEAPRNG